MTIEYEFGCGTILNSEELDGFVFVFQPNEEGVYDSGIGGPGQSFWDIDADCCDEYDLYFRESDDFSGAIEDNGGVYIPPSELHVHSHKPPRAETPLPLERQKELAKETLEKIRLASPRAIVAGGAARCFFLGEQANDIDIFLDLPSYLSVREMNDMLSKLLPERRVTRLTGGSMDGEPSSTTGLRAAFKFYEEGQEVQLLVVSGVPNEQHNLFPYSHTQISWDGSSFNMHDNFELFTTFNIVVRNRQPVPEAYEAKVNKLFEKLGCKVVDSAEEALSAALDSVQLKT